MPTCPRSGATVIIHDFQVERDSLCQIIITYENPALPRVRNPVGTMTAKLIDGKVIAA